MLVTTHSEFIASRWRYQAGEHVTILGRTGSGKTHLAYELLGATAHRRLPAVNMIMKPKDATVKAWSDRIGLRTVRSWPPPPSLMPGARPRGYTVWPHHTFDPDVDDARLWEVFRASILDSYKRGNRILFADEVAGLTNDLRHPKHRRTLARELEAVWMRGRSMGTGVWAASQRPAYIPLQAYQAAEHVFLAAEPDARNRKRFDEIGALDPKVVSGITAELGQYEFLYIRRTGSKFCVITP